MAVSCNNFMGFCGGGGNLFLMLYKLLNKVDLGFCGLANLSQEGLCWHDKPILFRFEYGPSEKRGIASEFAT